MIIKAVDYKKEEATKRVYLVAIDILYNSCRISMVVACKDNNELFIYVVSHEARLFHLNIIFFL